MSKPTAHRPVVVGHFDRIVDEQAYGWAYHPEVPGNRLTIEIVCDNNVVGRGEAGLLRDDLIEAGIGDGYHHFDIPLSIELYNGKPQQLIARDAATGTILNGGPHTFNAPPKPQIAEMISRDQGVFLLRDLLQQTEFARYRKNVTNIFRAYLFASLLQETRQTEEARVAYEALAQAIGANALCHCKIAETWLLQNHFGNALESYRQAASEDPRLFWAHLGIGNTYRLQGNTIAAEEAVQTALALEPDNKDIQTRLAQIQAEAILAKAQSLVNSGKREEAIKTLTTLVLEDPEHPMAVPALVKLLSRVPENSQLPGMQELQDFQGTYLLLNMILDEIEKRAEAKEK